MAVFLKDIAEVAGVSKMTVSRALRDAGHVSRQERERICRIAGEMGYEPDPAASRLASRRWGKLGRTVDSSLTLLLWNKPSKRRPPAQERIKNGVVVGAKELGYRVEVLNLFDRGSAKGLDRELRSRGVQGLVIGRLSEKAPELDLSWEHYTVVKAHSPLAKLPPFAMVRMNPAEAMIFALGKIVSYGYRRIAVVLMKHDKFFLEDVMRAGVVDAMRPVLAKCGIELELLVFDQPYRFHDDAPRLGEWIEGKKPDVVFGFNDYIRLLLEDGCGYRMPEQFAYGSLHAVSGHSGVGGLASPDFTEGVGAVHLLDMLLRMDQRGIPASPIIQQPLPVWYDSPLLPKQRKLGKAVHEMLEECFSLLEWEGES